MHKGVGGITHAMSDVNIQYLIKLSSLSLNYVMEAETFPPILEI